MTDRAHIPSSPACGHWETLLADALDGLLKPEDEGTFAEHMASCQACTALFEEARKGREWLEFLSRNQRCPPGYWIRFLRRPDRDRWRAMVLSPVERRFCRWHRRGSVPGLQDRYGGLPSRGC